VNRFHGFVAAIAAGLFVSLVGLPSAHAQQLQYPYPPPQAAPYPQQPYANTYPPPQAAPYPQQPYPPPQPYASQPYAAPPPNAQQWGASPPPAPPPPKEKEEEGWEIDAEVFGLRGTSLAVSGGDREASTLGLGLASIGLANGQREILSYRGEGLSHIGGGQGGFEGELGGSITVGIGWLAAGTHGPFARVGFEGRLLGNDTFYLSALRFPRGEIGWHIGSKNGLVLEIGGTAAPMLDGRFNTGDEGRRRLGSSGGYGAYADLFIGPIAGTLEWTHTAAVSQPKTAVNELSGHVCLATGAAKKEYGLGLCFDGRATSGDVGFGDPFRTTDARSTYLGITLGLGTTVNK